MPIGTQSGRFFYKILLWDFVKLFFFFHFLEMVSEMILWLFMFYLLLGLVVSF